jgi:transposase
VPRRGAGRPVAATLVSAVGFMLVTILDSVRTSADVSLGVFWGLFTGDAVIACLAGSVAVLTAWRSRRHDATLRFGVVGIVWLILAQSIEIIWK